MTVSKQKKLIFGIVYSMVLVFTLCFSGLVISSYIKEKQEFEQFKQTWQYRADTNFTQSIKTDEETGEQVVVYNISTPEQLAGMFVHSEKVQADSATSHKVGDSYQLTQNLDLNGNTWVSVKSFTGNFDGNGFVISNLNNSFVDELTGIVENLSLEKINISRSGDTGAIANTSYGTIKNVHLLSGSISSSKGNLGGIVGIMYEGLVENCTNKATVSGTATNIGGFVGNANGGIVTRCLNSGGSKINLSDSSFNVGGIVGKNNASVYLCVNKQGIYAQNLKGDTCLGGIVGNNTGSIKKCVNNASIQGKSSLAIDVKSGGIVGQSAGGYTIEYCYNSKTVTANAAQGDEEDTPISYGQDTDVWSVMVKYTATTKNRSTKYTTKCGAYAGGIVGYLSGSSVKYCYNVGQVHTTNPGLSVQIDIGYIVTYSVFGYLKTQATITDTFVSEEYYYDGICGYNTNSKNIENCYNTNTESCASAPTFKFKKRSGSGENIALPNENSMEWQGYKNNKISIDCELYVCKLKNDSQKYTITEKFAIKNSTNLNYWLTEEDCSTIGSYTYDANSLRKNCSGTNLDPIIFSNWSSVFNSDYSIKDLYW